MSAETEHLRHQLIRAIGRWEAAKAEFAAVTAAYCAGTKPGAERVIAETRAAGDTRRQVAVADTSYYRSEASTYALALIALSLPTSTFDTCAAEAVALTEGNTR
jgi:hypothetical protein